MSSAAIVVGTDGSPRAELAVDRAGELGNAVGAPVHVVCVPGALEGAQWPARVSAQEVVAAAADRLRGRGTTVETHLPRDQGDPALALVDVAEQTQAQMIIVGNRGMTGIRRVMGSFPNRVSHGARCNVLIIATKPRAQAELAGRAIVVGADASDRLDEGIRLARALGSELHIVSTAKASDSPETALVEASDRAKESGVEAITHTGQDDMAAALLDVAEKHNAAMVVIGGKGMRTGERERFGNVADKLSHSGVANVLILSTDGTSSGDGGTEGVAEASTAQSAS